MKSCVDTCHYSLANRVIGIIRDNKQIGLLVIMYSKVGWHIVHYYVSCVHPNSMLVKYQCHGRRGGGGVLAMNRALQFTPRVAHIVYQLVACILSLEICTHIHYDTSIADTKQYCTWEKLITFATPITCDQQ